MRRRSTSLCGLAFALLAAVAGTADAQRVLGPGDDALVLPRGALRVRVLNQWSHFNERYGRNTPGRANDALEPLAIDFNLDTIGIAQFPSLAPVQTGLRSLTGIPDLAVSLGRTVVNSNVTVIATPVVVEVGVTERLSMGVIVPFVRTRNNIFFTANPAGREGNIGFNPGLGDPRALDSNRTLVRQFETAATQLSNSLAFCSANPSAGSCPQLLAQRSNAEALIANSRAFAGGLQRIYGTSPDTSFSPFVPIAGTTEQSTINARIAAFGSLYQSFLGTNPITGALIASPNRLGLTDAQTVLTDPRFGVAADPLQTVERSHIGDIEIGAKFLLLDSFRARGQDRLTPSGLNWRASVGANLRLGTGQTDSPQNFVDVGTGDGQTDVEMRGFFDVLYGSRFWTSVIGRYGIQLADELVVRISDRPEQRLTAAYRQQKVQRNLGDYWEFEANPRFALSDYVGLMAHYLYRYKAEDRYTGTFAIDSATTGFGPVTLDARTLNLETERMEHRLGGGISFSTVAAFTRGKAKIPLEVTYFHFQTTKGAGGSQPKIFSDQVQVRLYTRIFGGN